MAKLEWSDDIAAENQMRLYGATWLVKDVPLSTIDWDASRHNGARAAEPLKQQAVIEYAEAMKNGDVFPRIVLWRTNKSSKWVILGGNHRAAAAKSIGAASMPAYCIVSDDESISVVLPRMFNRVHGLRQSFKESLDHALYVISKYSMKTKDVARMFGVSTSSITLEQKARETAATLSKMGVNTNGTAKTTLATIASVSNHNVMAALANASRLKGLSGDEIRDVARRINSAKTEASQMAVVAELEKIPDKSLSTNSVAESRSSRRATFLRWLGSGETMLKSIHTLDGAQITTEEERKSVAKRISSLCGRLRGICQ